MAVRVKDPDDVLFWQQLKESVRMVEANMGLNLDITVGNRNANIRYNLDTMSVDISITEVEPKQPALLVP